MSIQDEARDLVKGCTDLVVEDVEGNDRGRKSL